MMQPATATGYLDDDDFSTFLSGNRLSVSVAIGSPPVVDDDVEHGLRERAETPPELLPLGRRASATRWSVLALARPISVRESGTSPGPE